MKEYLHFCLALLLTNSPIYPQATRIFLDGQFQDWQNLTPLYADPLGDFGQDEIDFGSLWATNDNRFLFLRIRFGLGMINLQSNNNVTIYLDTDHSAQTGLQKFGLGAELEWRFGQRTGVFYTNNAALPISHSNIGLVTTPTVSANEFEMAFERFALPDGSTQLFTDDSIRIAFSSSDDNDDLLPNAGETITFIFDETPLPPIQPIPIQKQNAKFLRVLSYNVAFDGLLDNMRLPAFTRLLQAVEPDIIGFQEIFSGTAAQTASQVTAMLPLPAGMSWHAAKIDPDIVTVSRFPIVQTFNVQNNGAFLIDLRPEYDSNLLLLNAHPPCCENDVARQFEVDAMMAFVRDAKAQGGVLTIAPNTPIMLMGDFNLVGSPIQLETLLTGRIINTLQFGSSFAPDWDGTDFVDLLPRHTDGAMFFTWFNAFESFTPGRLDFMIFSNSVLETRNSFVLFTPEMASDTLSKYNLLANDATLASDHLPVISDFELKTATSVDLTDQVKIDGFELAQNYPNPFNPSTTIEYTISSRMANRLVIVEVFDVLGELVRTLIRERQPAGSYHVRWDGTNESGLPVPNGVFFYRLSVGESVKTAKMLLIQ